MMRRAFREAWGPKIPNSDEGHDIDGNNESARGEQGMMHSKNKSAGEQMCQNAPEQVSFCVQRSFTWSRRIQPPDHLSLIAYTNGTVSNEFEAEAVAVDPM